MVFKSENQCCGGETKPSIGSKCDKLSAVQGTCRKHNQKIKMTSSSEHARVKDKKMLFCFFTDDTTTNHDGMNTFSLLP
jgi:hypothetical protein